MKVDPNAPAYPVVQEGTWPREGMPIRLAIAAQIMVQLVVDTEELGAKLASEWALRYADALIAAHNEEK